MLLLLLSFYWELTWILGWTIQQDMDLWSQLSDENRCKCMVHVTSQKASSHSTWSNHYSLLNSALQCEVLYVILTSNLCWSCQIQQHNIYVATWHWIFINNPSKQIIVFVRMYHNFQIEHVLPPTIVFYPKFLKLIFINSQPTQSGFGTTYHMETVNFHDP